MQPYEITSKEKTNNNASQNITENIRSIKEDGSHIAETVMAQGQDMYEQAKSYSRSYIKMLEKEVVAKPVQSLAIAVGAGIVLSFLLRRV